MIGQNINLNNDFNNPCENILFKKNSYIHIRIFFIPMKLISWNLNGIRAVQKKGLAKIIDHLNADIIGFQETKAQDKQVREALYEVQGYHIYSNSAVKKGYSGTAIITKKEPINVTFGLGIEEHDQEGRLISAEFEQFFFITTYAP